MSCRLEQIYQIQNLQIVARVNHNLLTVTTRRRVHQWHIQILKLNGRYQTLSKNCIYTNFGMTLEQRANTVITDHNVFTSDKGRGTCFCPSLSVCLLARLLKNACMDLDEMLRVDRCRDMDELINF